MRNIVLFLTSFIISTSCFSYPQYIGHGYNSCITCHYNPEGNGPLNDYGRAIGATAIAARWFHDENITEEELGKKSGFFGFEPFNTWLRPSLDYRGLMIKRDFNEKTEETEWINMMADLNVVIKFDPAARYFTSVTFGYAPTPSVYEKSNTPVDQYRWHEAYFGMRPFEGFGAYLGLMDKVYGIRIAEHSSYSRSVTNLSHNDQSHGLQLHYTNEFVELTGGYFLGNLAQKERLRQKGFSGKAEYKVNYKNSVGVSVLKSNNKFLDMYMAAFHYKTAVGKGSAFMAEYGKVVKESISEKTETSQVYGLGQVYLQGTRGLFLINSIEYLKDDTGDFRIRYGPGLQVFPARSFEFRFELYNARSFSDTGSTRDTWDLLGQTHLWF